MQIKWIILVEYNESRLNELQQWNLILCVLNGL